MRIVFRKVVIFVIFYLIWTNIWFFIFVKDVYSDPFYLISLILYYLVSFADVMIRPQEERRLDAIRDKYDKIMGLLIISSPIWFCVYIFEYKLLFSSYIDSSFSFLGIIFFMIGSIILLTSRIQLGRFASGKLKIQKDHELITTGIYKYVRNPIYLGGLIGVLGMGLSFRSLFVVSGALVLDTYVFIQRILREEELLETEFGDEFIQYKKKTRSLLPFLY
ncbi:MAG: methyltransferase family protein [Candidatus Hodarchaeales archaeon]